MEPFRIVTGPAAPLPRANVDTDAIISSRSPLHVGRRGYGKFLFAAWRTLPDGAPDPEFVLNQPAYAGCTILLTGDNFGCGSSRETAVWALSDAGIRCVVASSFGTIFAANCARNGLLTAVASATHVSALSAHVLATVAAGGPPEVTVDLESQTITAPGAGAHPFDVDPRTRYLLLGGLDAIAITLQHVDLIEAHRRRDAERHPWVYDLHEDVSPGHR